jgi:hypothetical protein
MLPAGCVLAALLVGCDAECIVPPCALPIAIQVTVSSAVSGGPVPGASLEVSGALSTTIACGSECMVPGSMGTYLLTLSAPGFQPLQRTVVVHGTTRECSCPVVETERITLVLQPVT